MMLPRGLPPLELLASGDDDEALLEGSFREAEAEAELGLLEAAGVVLPAALEEPSMLPVPLVFEFEFELVDGGEDAAADREERAESVLEELFGMADGEGEKEG